MEVLTSEQEARQTNDLTEAQRLRLHQRIQSITGHVLKEESRYLPDDMLSSKLVSLGRVNPILAASAPDTAVSVASAESPERLIEAWLTQIEREGHTSKDTIHRLCSLFQGLSRKPECRWRERTIAGVARAINQELAAANVGWDTRPGQESHMRALGATDLASSLASAFPGDTTIGDALEAAKPALISGLSDLLSSVKFREATSLASSLASAFIGNAIIRDALEAAKPALLAHLTQALVARDFWTLSDSVSYLASAFPGDPTVRDVLISASQMVPGSLYDPPDGETAFYISQVIPPLCRGFADDPHVKMIGLSCLSGALFDRVFGLVYALAFSLMETFVGDLEVKKAAINALIKALHWDKLDYASGLASSLWMEKVLVVRRVRDGEWLTRDFPVVQTEVKEKWRDIVESWHRQEKIRAQFEGLSPEEKVEMLQLMSHP